jgi:hypothetical protein
VGGTTLAAKGLAALGKSLDMTVPSVDLFKGGVIGALGEAVLGVVKSLKNQIGVYSDLYKEGIAYAGASNGVTSNLQDFATHAYIANVSLQDMANILKTGNKSISKFGIGTFTEMSKSVSEYGLKFGLSTTESAQYLGEYLEQQRQYGNYEAITQEKAIAGAKQQIEMTTQLGRAYQLSVSELNKNREEMVKSVSFKSAMMSINSRFRNESGEFLSTFGATLQGIAPELSEMLTDMVYSGQGLMAGNKQLLALRAGGQGDLANKMQDIATKLDLGQLSKEDADAELQKVLASADTSDAAMNQMKMMSTAFPELRKTIAQLSEVKSAKERRSRLKNNLGTEEDKAAEAAGNLANIQTRFGNTWSMIVTSLFGGAGSMDLINTMLSKVSKFMADNSERLMKLMTTFVEKQLPKIMVALDEGITWLQGFMDGTKKIDWSSITSTISQGVGVALIAGIAYIFSGTLIRMLASYIGGLIGTFFTGTIFPVISMVSPYLMSMMGALGTFMLPFIMVCDALYSLYDTYTEMRDNLQGLDIGTAILTFFEVYAVKFFSNLGIGFFTLIGKIIGLIPGVDKTDNWAMNEANSIRQAATQTTVDIFNNTGAMKVNAPINDELNKQTKVVNDTQKDKENKTAKDTNDKSNDNNTNNNNTSPNNTVSLNSDTQQMLAQTANDLKQMINTLRSIENNTRQLREM